MLAVISHQSDSNVNVLPKMLQELREVILTHSHETEFGETELRIASWVFYPRSLGTATCLMVVNVKHVCA